MEEIPHLKTPKQLVKATDIPDRILAYSFISITRLGKSLITKTITSLLLMPYFKVFYPSEMHTPAIPPRRVIAIYFFFPRSIRRRLDVVSKRVYLFTQFSFTHFFYFFLSVSYIYINPIQNVRSKDI